MFNRNAKKFTDKYLKDLAGFNGDEYAAEWLTRICTPALLPRRATLLDTPRIRTKLAIVGWSELNFDKDSAEEVF